MSDLKHTVLYFVDMVDLPGGHPQYDRDELERPVSYCAGLARLPYVPDLNWATLTFKSLADAESFSREWGSYHRTGGMPK